MTMLRSCLFACTLLAGTATLAVNADAQSPARAGITAGTQPTDVSSARKKRRAAVYVAPAYGPPAYSMWRGADPSYGPGTPQFRDYRHRGICVIDEGYGRFTSCSNH